MHQLDHSNLIRYFDEKTQILNIFPKTALILSIYDKIDKIDNVITITHSFRGAGQGITFNSPNLCKLDLEDRVVIVNLNHLLNVGGVFKTEVHDFFGVELSLQRSPIVDNFFILYFKTKEEGELFTQILLDAWEVYTTNSKSLLPKDLLKCMEKYYKNQENPKRLNTIATKFVDSLTNY